MCDGWKEQKDVTAAEKKNNNNTDSYTKWALTLKIQQATPQPSHYIQKNSSRLNSLKNMATVPVLSSSTSILAPNSCCEVMFCSMMAEKIAKGPESPTWMSWAVVE